MTAASPEEDSSPPSTSSGEGGLDDATQLKPRAEQPVGQEDEAAPEPDIDPQEHITPGSLRMDPQVGEELYGTQLSAAYSRINARGVNALGNNNTIHVVNNAGEPMAKPVIRNLVGVPDLLAVYAETAADGELGDKLDHRSTACLAGRPHTGRFSTACVALARRHGPDRVHEILLPGDVAPEVLSRAGDSIEEDHGYVLRLPGNRHSHVMRLLADLFRRRSASLLLIRHDDSRAGVRHSAEVQHQRPEPLAVFRAHLGHHLRDRLTLTAEESAELIRGYLRHSGLVQALTSSYGPREVVPIAEAVGQGHPADEDTLAEIIQSSQPRRRARAAEILDSDAGGATASRRPRRADQHERTFRIAYAVFARQPLHYVFEAAALLLEEIDGQAKRLDWGRLALQYPVSELLGPLKVDWQEGREATRLRGGSSRSAWLHDGAMRGVIIDEAWHEFDSTRPALLKWLNRLVLEDEEPMQQAAAEAAGLLAHHDFARVCADLIDDWAASPRPRLRQAAAWAMVAADMGGQVGHLVRRQIREWAGGHRNFQRDAAARVYASGLQQPDLSWSLSDLRRIAQDPMQQHMYTVAEGVYQLYAPHRAAQIIVELSQWSEDPQLQLHAGGALLSLATIPVDNSPTGVPELLVRAAAHEVDSGDLVRLWQVALLTASLSRRAWITFEHWLTKADADETVRKATAALVTDLAALPPLRRRTTFHLVRMPQFENGLPEWLDAAMRK
ncbi:hypothetical protein KBX50_27300 [Micromonospora sp. C51]|uniref:hypothetical protein n=1 Tax=Micromonospora sp. C51 TaxID=2824879 RepID=UPI001B35D293|nr:hypothetical protein [Micromonospora sp. C51]MBQ1052150.1 hypothetical protein [Micromonospora sp. C51]